MFAITSSSCGGSAAPMTPAQRGRIVYMTNCVICHNANPNLPGTQGPPIAGSPRVLVYDRVMFLKYPPGYKPKRTTHAMRAAAVGKSNRRFDGIFGGSGAAEVGT